MPNGIGEDKFSEIEKRVASLEEKIDELEDLIMAENLGMIELKKTLDEMKTITPAPSEIEEKIKKLEEGLASLPPAEAVGVGPAEDQIRLIMEEIEALKEELEALKAVRGVDVKPIFEEINTLRKNIDSRFLVIEKSLESLEERSKSQLPEKILEEVGRAREEHRARIENLEKFVGDFARRVESLRPYLERPENLERIEALSREAEEKIQRFREMEENLKRLGSEMHASYSGINERLERIMGMEREFARFADMLAMLRKEMDDNRVEILQRVKREDINKMLKEFERAIPTRPTEVLSEKISSLENEYRNLVRGLAQKLEERRPKELQSMIVEIAELSKSVSSIAERVNEIERKTAFYEEDFRRSVEEIKSFVNSRISELQTSSLIQSRFDELMERTVSFESRLVAIERIIKDTLRGQPVIIE